MNYKHDYHAGSVADVFKHMVLIQLLKNLHKKPGAFTYFETHAGNAIYDLLDIPAQKTLEHEGGISALWQNSFTNYVIEDFIKIVELYNPSETASKSTLKLYPGSSLFARHYLREDDKAILCELHPEVYQKLHQYYKQDKQVHVHNRNGYEALLALLPPKTTRGLVLIDPPFEVKDEFQQLLKVLEKAQLRWLAGMYALWFPIKKYEIILEFYNSLRKLSFKNILTTEFWSLPETDDNLLKGSGLVIINPPWQLDVILQELLPDLAKALNISAQKNNKVNWLIKS